MKSWLVNPRCNLGRSAPVRSSAVSPADHRTAHLGTVGGSPAHHSVDDPRSLPPLPTRSHAASIKARAPDLTSTMAQEAASLITSPAGESPAKQSVWPVTG